MSTPHKPTRPKPKRRAPGVTAAGFLVAFGLSTATIIYTGLKVGAPRQHRGTEPPVESRQQDAAVVAGAEVEPEIEPEVVRSPEARDAAPEEAAQDERAGDEPDAEPAQ